MLLASAQANKQLAKGQAGSEIKGGVKRRREEDEESKVEGDGPRSVRFADEQPGGLVEGVPMPPPTVATSLAAAAVSATASSAYPSQISPTFSLSESGVRDYLVSRGGKVSTKDLIEVGRLLDIVMYF